MSAFDSIRIDAGRVRLRNLNPVDVEAIFGIFSHPEVMRYWSRPAMTEVSEAVTMLHEIMAGYADESLLQLGVERVCDGILVGTCTLHHFHRSNRRAEIGYALGRPYWGAGLMHEALVAIVDHAFGPLALHRLEADIDPRNLASERSLTRLGFSREGHLRERWIVNGEVSDSGLYGLLARDWAALKARRN